LTNLPAVREPNEIFLHRLNNDSVVYIGLRR
jgi:hypothetical protein